MGGCLKMELLDVFNENNEYLGYSVERSKIHEDNLWHHHVSAWIMNYDGKVLPFKDCSFDNVFSSEVIEHIDNLDEILDEINRVLKPNGKFMLTTPFVWNENEVPFDYARYNSYGLEKILNRHGFSVIEKRKSLNFIEILYQMKAEYYRGIFDRFHSIHADRFVRLTFIPVATLKGLILGRLLPKDDSLYGNNIIICEKYTQ